jgi:Family of unknown function (DUF5703)
MHSSGAVWEFREFWFPRGTTREVARQALTEMAEQERWELSRVAILHDGRRKVVLRRKVYRVRRTA